MLKHLNSATISQRLSHIASTLPAIPESLWELLAYFFWPLYGQTILAACNQTAIPFHGSYYNVTIEQTAHGSETENFRKTTENFLKTSKFSAKQSERMKMQILARCNSAVEDGVTRPFYVLVPASSMI
jgi:hypothetical protein